MAPFNFEEEVKERELRACHILIATFLGKLAEMGALNLGFLNQVIPQVADRLAKYLEIVYGAVPSITDERERIERVFKEIVSSLDLFKNYKVIKTDDVVFFMIDALTCKICPGAVGGAVLKGSLCPFPALFKELLCRRLKAKFVLVNPKVSKIAEGENVYCTFGLKIVKEDK